MASSGIAVLFWRNTVVIIILYYFIWCFRGYSSSRIIVIPFINNLRAEQNGRYFANDIFKCILLKDEKLRIRYFDSNFTEVCSVIFVPGSGMFNYTWRCLQMSVREVVNSWMVCPRSSVLIVLEIRWCFCLCCHLIFNTLRPRQNGRHFADDIFKCIFLNENVWIAIKISLKFVPKGPINNIPALVQIMAWRRPGDKPLPEPIVVSLTTHICVTRPQWVNTKYSTDRVCCLHRENEMPRNLISGAHQV